jgi:uncharacterized protein YndB with AHSA1/START domain
LAKQAAKPALVLALPNDNTVILRRVFDAPRRLVFDAWTKPEHLKKWWGCDRTKMAECELDLKVGGGFRFVLKADDDSRFAFTGVYKEIDPPGRLVFTECFNDAGLGNPENLTTLVFEEVDGKTVMTATSVYDSRAHRDGHLEAGMAAGAAQSFYALDRLIESIK